MFIGLICLVWQIPTAVARNIATILVTRFLAGFSGAAFLSVAGGSITDTWIKEEASWPMVIYTLGPFVGPTLGPVVGGFINQHVSWRWTFYVVIIWSGIQVFSLCGISLREVCDQFLCSGNLWSFCS